MLGRRAALLGLSHLATFGAGIAGGIYLLPILTAPPAPEPAALDAAAAEARYRASLDRNHPGSDALHWGEGEVFISPRRIVHRGRLAPGPDYRFYLTPELVANKASFAGIKPRSVQVGEVKSFNGFILDIPPQIEIDAYTSLLIWCEAFSQFITAARYR
ncbi:MAG: DM13 domain-containing protein [Alphaproteobacteria bacterium]|nr:DM13 domain-containing protein [Alphaproteobacteria bacterium]